MTIPNWITTFRFLLVPVVIWAMMAGQMWVAFAAFVIAGLSDGLDGFIARNFNQRSELGAWLDPAADKLLLISVFIGLGFLELLPLWLIVLIVSRDVLIIGAVVLGALLGQPFAMKPLFISKANTVLQIILAATLLLEMSLNRSFTPFHDILIITVTFLTLASSLAYVQSWTKFMGDYDQKS